MNQTPSFITTCSEDENGDLALDIPQELLEALGWGEGTNLDISALPGTIVLRKVEPTPEPATDSPIAGEGSVEGGDSPAEGVHQSRV
jgi:bifunctional DNA-binding transcriptional regulator/antitoxin component of YhaV-PrlF toxin-antitoxin module